MTVVTTLFALVSLTPGLAAAEDPELTATMECDRTPEPGRVRCSIEARTKTGRSLAWADVAILELPDFASALRGRIGTEGVVARDAGRMKWAFGVVARSGGQGEGRARVRAVVCDAPPSGSAPGSEGGTSRCAPITVDVRAVIHVG